MLTNTEWKYTSNIQKGLEENAYLKKETKGWSH